MRRATRPTRRPRRDDGPNLCSEIEALFFQAYPFAHRATQVRSAAATARHIDIEREDLEQDALIGVWLALSKFNPARASLRTYVERVVDSSVMSALRRAKAKKRTARGAPPPTPALPPLLVRIELRVDIERALRELRKRDRKVARLLAECRPSDVARTLGISRQAVHRSMQRIRMALCAAGFGEFV